MSVVAVCKLMEVWGGCWMLICLWILFIVLTSETCSWNLSNPLKGCFNWVVFAVTMRTGESPPLSLGFAHGIGWLLIINLRWSQWSEKRKPKTHWLLLHCNCPPWQKAVQIVTSSIRFTHNCSVVYRVYSCQQWRKTYCSSCHHFHRSNPPL